MTSSQSAKRRLPPDDRREQIFDAALDLVDAGGVEAVTIQAVARKAGVTRPLVYDFFADRNALVSQLFAREEALALRDALGAVASAPSGPDFPSFLADSLATFLEMVLRRPKTWRVILLRSRSLPAEAQARLTRGRAEVAARVEALVRTLVRDTEDAADLPDVVAVAVVAACESAARMVLEDPETYPPRRVADAVRTVAAMFDFGPLESVTSFSRARDLA